MKMESHWKVKGKKVTEAWKLRVIWVQVIVEAKEADAFWDKE